MRISRVRPDRRILIFGTMVLASVILVVLLSLGLPRISAAVPELNPEFVDFHRQNDTLTLPDPGAPGPYAVDYFTYGSGHDRRRPEYAAQVRFVTQSVDGSRIYRYWNGVRGWLKTQYWGFDAAHLPLQARVWMPRGGALSAGAHRTWQPSQGGII